MANLNDKNERLKAINFYNNIGENVENRKKSINLTAKGLSLLKS